MEQIIEESGLITLTLDDAVELFKRYAKAEMTYRHDDEKSNRNVDITADMYSRLAADSFTHDLPALATLFEKVLAPTW